MRNARAGRPSAWFLKESLGPRGESGVGSGRDRSIGGGGGGDSLGGDLADVVVDQRLADDDLDAAVLAAFFGVVDPLATGSLGPTAMMRIARGSMPCLSSSLATCSALAYESFIASSYVQSAGRGSSPAWPRTSMMLRWPFTICRIWSRSFLPSSRQLGGERLEEHRPAHGDLHAVAEPAHAEVPAGNAFVAGVAGLALDALLGHGHELPHQTVEVRLGVHGGLLWWRCIAERRLQSGDQLGELGFLAWRWLRRCCPRPE